QREATSPAESLIHQLHPWVAFGIMPLFALANAGVTLAGIPSEGPSTRVILGTALGLLLGKPIGVLAACGAALASRVAILPSGLDVRHLLVLGLVAGIGFTMALFVAQLAFSDAALLGAAKVGILSASGAAAVLALGVGRVLLPATCAPDAAQTADEAERSTLK
ncbi:MAG TPA: Na+/H+ antiporter NhaA, partial [Polyangiales bacterium]|nr:Na+/H+ antiporter NhaA [Polyangiales bacterium]